MGIKKSHTIHLFKTYLYTIDIHIATLSFFVIVFDVVVVDISGLLSPASAIFGRNQKNRIFDQRSASLYNITPHQHFSQFNRFGVLE